MIPPHDQVCTPEVLAEQGVQEGLPGAGVAHLYGVSGLDRGAGYEIVFDQDVDGVDPDLRRDVARLEGAQDLMDEQAVADLDGDLGQILVRAVHGIAGLEGGDRGPAVVLEQGQGLGRAQIKPDVGLRVVALVQGLEGPARLISPWPITPWPRRGGRGRWCGRLGCIRARDRWCISPWPGGRRKWCRRHRPGPHPRRYRCRRPAPCRTKA